MSKKLNVAFLATALPGDSMYRIGNFAKYLHKKKLANVKCTPIDLKSSNAPAWENFLSEKSVLDDIFYLVRQADVVVCQKFVNERGIPLIQALRREFEGIKIVFEIDDYMFNVPSWNMASSMFRPGTGLFTMGMEQILRSNAIMTSTNYLKKLYSEFHRPIYVAKNTVDFDWWGKVENNNKKNDKIRIGWAGANAHREDLGIIVPAVRKLTEEYGDKIEFYFWSASASFPEELKTIKGVVLNPHWVVIGQYPNLLKKIGLDIGLAPLRDCYFNRAKSNLRWVEYSCLGIPTIASDIGGQFNECIVEGETGMLCKVPDDWYGKIKNLIEDKELRLKMGKQAQENVITDYNAETSCKGYLEMLKQIREVKTNVSISNGRVGTEVTKPSSISQ